MTRDRIRFVVFLATLIFVAAGLFILTYEPTSSIEFDESAWKSGTRDTRARMVASLLEYPQAGLPGASVRDKYPPQSLLYNANLQRTEDLLGPADSIRANGSTNRLQWSRYYIGDRGHWDGGQFVLTIFFDERGIAESFFVGR